MLAFNRKIAPITKTHFAMEARAFSGKNIRFECQRFVECINCLLVAFEFGQNAAATERSDFLTCCALPMAPTKNYLLMLWRKDTCQNDGRRAAISNMSRLLSRSKR